MASYFKNSFDNLGLREKILESFLFIFGSNLEMLRGYTWLCTQDTWNQTQVSYVQGKCFTCCTIAPDPIVFKDYTKYRKILLPK